MKCFPQKCDIEKIIIRWHGVRRRSTADKRECKWQCSKPTFEFYKWCNNWKVVMVVIKLYNLIENFANFALFAAWDFFWVDAVDSSRPRGHFLWADGKEVSDSTWFKLFPRKYGRRKTCVILCTGYDKLGVYPCSYKSHTLCELSNCLWTTKPPYWAKKVFLGTSWMDLSAVHKMIARF